MTADHRHKESLLQNNVIETCYLNLRELNAGTVLITVKFYPISKVNTWVSSSWVTKKGSILKHTSYIS